MAGFEQQKNALTAQGAKVVLAGSVDPEDRAKEVAGELSYPVAFGITREQGESFGAWWDEGRSIIQPAEFILRPDGRVLSSTYSSGPIGRVAPEDAVKLVTLYASRE